jgi:5-methylcytosine-specific restriction endonuclease McrA
MGFNSNTLTQAYHRQNGKCAICGIKLDGSYEGHHILMQKHGGPDSVDNCAVLHERCHREDAHGGNTRNDIKLDRYEYRYING